jgi:hypothetical protein
MSGRWHPEILPIQHAELLGGELRHAVRRERLRQGVLTHRQRHVVAVDRRARGVDQTLDGAPDTRFEQDLGGLHVVDRIDAEIASPALTDAGLGRQVEDVGAIGEQRVELGLLDRRFDELEAGG